MSGFDADWLALREPADRAARSLELERRFGEAVHDLRGLRPGPLRLIDLGGGTAANFRALAPALGGDQHWLLCDHDPALLAAVPVGIARWAQAHGWSVDSRADAIEVRTADSLWCLETRAIDLAADLETIDAGGADGIATTAFLDLVSEAWLERLARWVINADRPLLATLTVDGERRWSPSLPDDELIDSAFRAHQGGDKGFGDSIGPGAAQAFARILEALDCRCEVACSDWRIDHQSGVFLQTMAREAAMVAGEVMPAERDRIARWLAAREQGIEAGDTELTVGHLDLLALPGTRLARRVS